MEYVNVLTSTASELQDLLSQNKTNSVELVKLYLNQIEAHNKNGLKLNAIISIAPRDELLAIAASLDAERAERGPRGPLHGIPVIVKVCAATYSPLEQGASIDYVRIQCLRLLSTWIRPAARMLLKVLLLRAMPTSSSGPSPLA